MREFFWKIFQEISLSDANTADLKTIENLENLLPIFLTEKKFRVKTLKSLYLLLSVRRNMTFWFAFKG